MADKFAATFCGLTEDEFEELTGYSVQDAKDFDEFLALGRTVDLEE